MTLNVGSLFTGIGGFDLGLEWAGMDIKWQVENNLFCNKILAKHWPKVRRYGDIKKIKKGELEPVQVVCGGFPCQPFSIAGKRRGSDDDRYLWPDMFRVIREVRPRWVIAENVVGIVRMALDTVLSDLEGEGYWNYLDGEGRRRIAPFIIPACAVNAPHRRDRVWIVAYDEKQIDWKSISQESKRQIQKSGKCDFSADLADTESRRKGSTQQSRQWDGIEQGSQDMADTTDQRSERHREEYGLREIEKEMQTCRGSWWSTEPDVGRVAHGVPSRVDRLKSLGNAVVPKVVYEIGKVITDIERLK